MSESTAKKNQNSKVGHVVSTKMDKTIVVEVTRRVAHPLYRRVVSRKKKFHAHDAENTCRVGDFVRITECRPMSRTKRWQLKEVLRRAVQVGKSE
jgi:small subunit ribosomal protein S17